MITTERLILRPFTEKDAADLLEYLHEPTVHCFFDMKISSMDEAKEEAIKRMKTDYYFAIELKDTGKVIGEVFVHPDGEGMEEEHSEEVYFNDTYSPCWMLNKDYHGKGYAYTAITNAPVPNGMSVTARRSARIGLRIRLLRKYQLG